MLHLISRLLRLLLLRFAPYPVCFKELGDDFRVLFQRTGLLLLGNLVERRKIGQTLRLFTCPNRSMLLNFADIDLVRDRVPLRRCLRWFLVGRRRRVQDAAVDI